MEYKLPSGLTEFPGIGCFNFAIFNSAEKFGATAHIMEPKVDTGKIIDVEYFSIDAEKENVETLSIKTYNALLILYRRVFEYVFKKSKIARMQRKMEKKALQKIRPGKISYNRSQYA